MIQVTQEMLDEMVRTIVAEVQPEKIYLFGSLARGEATEDSDIDLLIVERLGFADRSRWQELQKIRSSLLAFRLPKDILVYSQDEVARWQNSFNHIVAHALREGRLLYKKN